MPRICGARVDGPERVPDRLGQVSHGVVGRHAEAVGATLLLRVELDLDGVDQPVAAAVLEVRVLEGLHGLLPLHLREPGVGPLLPAAHGETEQESGHSDESR